MHIHEHNSLMDLDSVEIQFTATHCNALQHTATHCNTLQRTATHSAYIQMNTVFSWTHMMKRCKVPVEGKGGGHSFTSVASLLQSDLFYLHGLFFPPSFISLCSLSFHLYFVYGRFFWGFFFSFVHYTLFLLKNVVSYMCSSVYIYMCKSSNEVFYIHTNVYKNICTADPTWGDIFECCSIAQSSKLERLFSMKCGKRDVRALSFELLKMSPQVGLAVFLICTLLTSASISS